MDREPSLPKPLRLIRNPARGADPKAVAHADVRAFHSSLGEYAVTPLHESPRLAEELGLDRVLVKVETDRLGLPSFKALGAVYATCAMIARALGDGQGEPAPLLEDLRRRVQESPRSLRVQAATDGNHGRAVAWAARQLGLPARIYVPEGTAADRCRAIADEGAECIEIDGGYDDAVALSLSEVDVDTVVVNDMAHDAFAPAAHYVIDGYATILAEVAEQLGPDDQPDLVVVQMGCGAFAAAAIRHFRAIPGSRAIVGVEPESAACVLEALEAGKPVSLTEPQTSIMAGLNCGTASAVAWPELATGLDWSMTVTDESARDAMRDLAAEGLAIGESGAAGLAALRTLAAMDAEVLRSASTALIFATEGATDPTAFERIVGLAPDAVGVA